MKKIFLIMTFFVCTLNIYASTTIDVTKKLNGVDNISNTFTYSVVPKDTNPEIINVVDNFNFEFTNDDIANKMAIKTYTIDFGDVPFTKLGRYEYVVSEVASSNEDVYPIDTNKYTIIVNVVNALDSNNEPTGEKIIDVLGLAYFNDSSGKSEIIFETNPLTYITISKKVTGDLADMGEYFKFKINIDAGDNYVISGQDEVVNYNGEVINTITNYDASVDNYIYLKHGQSVTIGLDNNKMYIPSSTDIDVEEIGADSYKTHINGDNMNRKIIAMRTINTPEHNTLSYVNNLESNVLTGLFVNNMPFIILAVVSLLGFIIIRKKVLK